MTLKFEIKLIAFVCFLNFAYFNESMSFFSISGLWILYFRLSSDNASLSLGFRQYGALPTVHHFSLSHDM